MITHTHANQVVTLSFERFAPLPVEAHVSTRHGGVSPAPWDSLNFSVRRGDTPERVTENFRRLCEAVGVRPDQVVQSSQVHGTGIAKVSWSDAGTRPADTDGLITDAQGLPLFLVFADCVPVVVYDPRHHALGVCHSGWRGTVNGTTAATLWAMQAAYGTRPEEVQVGVGPSIGPQSYEVGPSVVEMAHARLPNARRFFTYPNGSPHFDLWQANAAQLTAAGVPPAQIEISAIDTAANTGDFFSHRAEQGRCGLFGVLAWLGPQAATQGE